MGGDLGADGQLERTVGFKSALAIGVAAMTGSCLVLPGGAAYYSGSSAFLAILISGIIATPHCFCVSELATAMPINGGEFVYLSQAYGPMIGTMCGVGLYASLLLKGSFGLVGSLYYLEAVTGELSGGAKIGIKMGTLALITCLNLIGMKKLKSIQKKMTLGATLLLFLLALVALKDFDGDSLKSDHFFKDDFSGVLKGAAFVYMSFAGITKICSVGGEIKRPGKTLPKAITTAAFGMTLFFSITTLAIVGGAYLKTSLDGEEYMLKEDYSPFYTMGYIAGGEGKTGGDVIGWITAVVSIVTMVGMANVAIAAVSRFPYAMARDGLLPHMLTNLLSNGSPHWCILMSSLVMGVCVLTVDVKGIAKLASSFNLIVFISGDISLMIYKTNSHGKYKPLWEAPYYPFMPLAGVVGQGALLIVMGPEGLYALLVFGLLGFLLYYNYGRHHAKFLGVLLPEAYLGVLPDHFVDHVALEKELMRIRKDPLYHFHKGDLFSEGSTEKNSFMIEKHRASEVGITRSHTRTYEFDAKKSRSTMTGLKSATLLAKEGHDQYIYRIAFTGGHHGGKTTIINLLAKEITQLGYDVYLCPKISAFFTNHGVMFDKSLPTAQKVVFQAEIMRTQLRHERAFLRLAGIHHRPSVVLFNRGLMDIKAEGKTVFEDTWVREDRESSTSSSSGSSSSDSADSTIPLSAEGGAFMTDNEDDEPDEENPVEHSESSFGEQKFSHLSPRHRKKSEEPKDQFDFNFVTDDKTSMWDDTLDICDVDETYLLDRYDAVFHCETECANPGYNGERDAMEEMDKDAIYKEVWKNHAEHIILHYSKEFTSKIKIAKEEVLRVLESHHHETAHEQPDFDAGGDNDHASVEMTEEKKKKKKKKKKKTDEDPSNIKVSYSGTATV